MQNITSEMSLWRLFLSGGPLMWPILLCSLFSLAITIRKFFYFSGITADVYQLRDAVYEALKQNDIKGAMEACDRHNSPVGKVLKSGLIKFGSSGEEMAESMENTARFSVAALEDGLAILSAIGQIAPLLGLLGTVSGMSVIFYTINARAAAMNPLTSADIAGGIWQALITTVASLVVTILTMIAYHYFIARRDRYVAKMEQSAAELVAFSDHLRNGVSKE